MSSQAVSVFFPYSHQDEKLRDELAKHLSTLKRNGIISDWHDRKIFPGDKWERQIKDHLNTAQIILLLISSDFIASDYCHDVEIKRALERYRADEAMVIPVILRHCMWEDTPLGELQVLDGTPVTELDVWGTSDKAFLNIAKEIREAAIRCSNQAGAISHRKSVESTQKAESEAQTQYRERVKEYLIDRPLTALHESLLRILQKQLNLPKTKTTKIVSEELALIEQAKEIYIDELSKDIAKKHKLMPRQDRIQIQQKLQLTEAEVTELEQPIIEVMGSEREIDHTKLRDLLEAGKWQAADTETYEVMIRTVGKKAGQYFTKDDLLNFPCQDLLAIDRLWVRYSNGHFGFSVQNKIYVECGATLNGQYPDDKVWSEFSDQIGWRVDVSHQKYQKLIFSTSAPFGHLPGFLSTDRHLDTMTPDEEFLCFTFLVSRLVECTTPPSPGLYFSKYSNASF